MKREQTSSAREPDGAPLRALWHEAKGNWDTAHRIVQEEGGMAGARVHAYLHRREGDLSNADYWYARAGSERPSSALGKEWEALVRSFLDESTKAERQDP